MTRLMPDEVLRRLELTITRRLGGLLQGDYRGLVPGHGSESGETRRYVDGDDVRRIDWNVTARMQVPHLRQTVAEREMETWLLVDLSASLDWGTAQCTKRDLAVVGAAAAAFLTARAGNRLGAVLLTSDGPVVLPARRGRDHVRAVLHRVVATPQRDGRGPTDLAAGLCHLAALRRRRGLAVVVSDFLSSTDWEPAVRMVTAHHEVLAVEVLDPRELELPDVGLLVVTDPETGRQREVSTAHSSLRARYVDAARRQRDNIAGSLRHAGADHLRLRTDRDWLLDLVRFVALRRHRLEHLHRVTTASDRGGLAGGHR